MRELITVGVDCAREWRHLNPRPGRRGRPGGGGPRAPDRYDTETGSQHYTELLVPMLLAEGTNGSRGEKRCQVNADLAHTHETNKHIV